MLADQYDQVDNDCEVVKRSRSPRSTRSRTARRTGPRTLSGPRRGLTARGIGGVDRGCDVAVGARRVERDEDRRAGHEQRGAGAPRTGRPWRRRCRRPPRSARRGRAARAGAPRAAPSPRCTAGRPSPGSRSCRARGRARRRAASTTSTGVAGLSARPAWSARLADGLEGVVHVRRGLPVHDDRVGTGGGEVLDAPFRALDHQVHVEHAARFVDLACGARRHDPRRSRSAGRSGRPSRPRGSRARPRPSPRATCSPSRAKSAARIEGATRTSCRTRAHRAATLEDPALQQRDRCRASGAVDLLDGHRVDREVRVRVEGAAVGVGERPRHRRARSSTSPSASRHSSVTVRSPPGALGLVVARVRQGRRSPRPGSARCAARRPPRRPMWRSRHPERGRRDDGDERGAAAGRAGRRIHASIVRLESAHERRTGPLPAPRGRDPHPLGEPPPRPAGRPAPAAPPRHDGARRARRPHADLPDVADRPGDVDGPGGRDPGRRCARPTSSGAPRRSTARAGSSASSIPRRASTTSTRASRRPARTSRTAPSRRPTPTRRPASSGSPPRPAPGQWGSALAFACRLFGLECVVYMVGASYDQKPYRRAMMETWGATVHPLAERHDRRGPRPGRAPDRLARDRDLGGRGGGGAGRRTPTTRSARCSTTCCLHQTVIGQEAIAQLELAGDEPDVVVGCVGGGSNFAGLAFPFVRRGAARGARRPASWPPSRPRARR